MIDNPALDCCDLVPGLTMAMPTGEAAYHIRAELLRLNSAVRANHMAMVERSAEVERLGDLIIDIADKIHDEGYKGWAKEIREEIRRLT